MGKLLLITGTDTDVGKTTVTSVLAKYFVSHGFKVRAVKPIETGCKDVGNGVLAAADAALHAWALYGDDSRADECVLHKFAPPVAPLVATRMESHGIEREELLNWVREKSNDCDLLLVEGAGGLLVPILENYSFADFARDLEMDVLVVVGSRLGAGNHSALTFELRKSKGLKLIGYVFNDLYAEEAKNDPALAMNRALLREIGEIYRMNELGYLEKWPGPMDYAALERMSQTKNIEDLAANLVKLYSLSPAAG